LGIEFVNWGKNGDRYMHAFGDVGRNMHSLPFHQLWWKQFQQGKAEDLGAYALNSVASYQGKFMRPVNAGDSPLSSISYAFSLTQACMPLFFASAQKRRV
jgi:Tryptophan halogenase.